MNKGTHIYNYKGKTLQPSKAVSGSISIAMHSSFTKYKEEIYIQNNGLCSFEAKKKLNVIKKKKNLSDFLQQFSDSVLILRH